LNLSFSELRLQAPILRALDEQKYQTPTAIQIRAIPHLLEGRDLLGVSQTGTGKTAAFGLPILQRLSQDQARTSGAPRALVLTPTRELALQIADSFRAYGRHLSLRHAVVFGGVGQKPQVDALRRGADILVATPGRLLDLMTQGHVRLESVSIFVLDEADRMLDLGFLPQVRRIVAKLPKERQTLLFSATMPEDIARLADGILRQPVRVEATPVASTVEQVDQSVLFVSGNDKRNLLSALLKDPRMARCLVFVRTKHGANRLAAQLALGDIAVTALHSNKSQAARQKALESFRTGRLRVLVATDIMARGIDVDDITHVINFDLPNVPESYVHRIGRTARAGARGIALSFCDGSERPFLRDIEKLTRRPLRVIADHPYAGHSASPRGDTPTSRHAPADRTPPRQAPRQAQRKPAGGPPARQGTNPRGQRRLGRGAHSQSGARR
jgi:ATP-dependent RNA helicase RhlE